MTQYGIQMAEKRDMLVERAVGLMTPTLVEGMASIWVSAEDSVGVNGPVTRRFQELLKLVPSWTLEVRQQEARRVENTAPDLAHLLKQCVAASARVLYGKGWRETGAVETPRVMEFVHRVYMRLARQAWLYPRLYAVTTDKFDYGAAAAASSIEIKGAILDHIQFAGVDVSKSDSHTDTADARCEVPPAFDKQRESRDYYGAVGGSPYDLNEGEEEGEEEYEEDEEEGEEEDAPLPYERQASIERPMATPATPMATPVPSASAPTPRPWEYRAGGGAGGGAAAMPLMAHTPPVPVSTPTPQAPPPVRTVSIRSAHMVPQQMAQDGAGSSYGNYVSYQ